MSHKDLLRRQVNLVFDNICHSVFSFHEKCYTVFPYSVNLYVASKHFPKGEKSRKIFRRTKKNLEMVGWLNTTPNFRVCARQKFPAKRFKTLIITSIEGLKLAGKVKILSFFGFYHNFWCNLPLKPIVTLHG